MKIESKNLLKAVTKVAAVVNPQALLPITQNILFEIGEGLTLYGTNLETTIAVTVEDYENLEGDSFAVPSKTLLDLLKTLNEGLELIVSGNTLVIKANSGQYEIGVFPAGEFPKGEFLLGEKYARGYMFDQVIDLVGSSTSNDELRPAMGGIFFDQDGTTVATDGHRLTRLKANIGGDFIIPPKALSVIKGFQDEKVFYKVDNNFVHFSAGNLKAKVRLIEGQFPPYRKVIPADFEYTFLTSAKDLLTILKRVSLFSNDTTKQVKIDFNNSKTTVAGADTSYNRKAEEQLFGSLTKGLTRPAGDEKVVIGFNAKYLIEVLNTIGDTDIDIKFSAPNKPVVILPKNNPKLLKLVMPIML